MLGDETIIPVWHNITQAEIAEHSPILADRVAGLTLRGLDAVVEGILDVIQPNSAHKSSKGLTLGISPTSVRLYAGQWAAKSQVVLTNRGDSPAYAVTVKILIHGAGATAESLVIEADPQVPPFEETIGNVVISADQLRINCSNAQKEQIVFYEFHTVPAKGSRTLMIKGTTPVDSTAEFSIARFDDSPREILKRGPSDLAIMFQPIENALVHSMGIPMRRTR
jgi:hypothetical protein